MLTKLRDQLRDEVLRGTVDKYGNPRDEEKRAVLYVLERILAYVPDLHRDYEQSSKQLAEWQARGRNEGALYGPDRLI